MLKPVTSRFSSLGMILGALVGAPCFIGILLIPLGLGALGSALINTFDPISYVFMIVALALVVVSHIALRRAQPEFRPTRFVWAMTILTVAVIVLELLSAPSWCKACPNIWA